MGEADSLDFPYNTSDYGVWRLEREPPYKRLGLRLGHGLGSIPSTPTVFIVKGFRGQYPYTEFWVNITMHKGMGRRIAVLSRLGNNGKIDGSKPKSCTSYARYLMSVHLGRQLDDWEQVDHINNDKLDDRIENYQILTVGDNNRKSAITEFVTFNCDNCAKPKTVRKGQEPAAKGYKHGFCSRRCCALYSFHRKPK